jgi:agmatinase
MTFSELPFNGIATFLKCPYVTEPTTADGDVAVFGIPMDAATVARCGARHAPRALREVSTWYAYIGARGEASYDGEAQATVLDGVRFVDAGDVSIPPLTSVEDYHAVVIEKVRAILAAGLFPLAMGGDHSVTYPLLKGVHEARGGKPFHLVQFDTHMDYWDEEIGQKYSHASPIIRSHEQGLIDGLTQYGIRGLHNVSDNIELAQSRGAHIFWCEAAAGTPPDELVAHIEPGTDVYITFDIDALDPAIAPGTGTPEPGGFTYYEAKAILRSVAARANVIGMDMVEVSPPFDPSQLTSVHAVRLMLDTVGAVFAK